MCLVRAFWEKGNSDQMRSPTEITLACGGGFLSNFNESLSEIESMLFLWPLKGFDQNSWF